MLYSFLLLGLSQCLCCTHTHTHKHTYTNLHYYTCEDNALPYIHSREAYHNRYMANPNLNLVLNLVETEFFARVMVHECIAQTNTDTI